MTRDIIRHPGQPADQPWTMAQGRGRSLQITLPKGMILMQAVAEAMDAAGADSGAMEAPVVSVSGKYMTVSLNRS